MKIQIITEIELNKDDLRVLNCIPAENRKQINRNAISYMAQLNNYSKLSASLNTLRNLGIITEVYNEEIDIFETTKFGEEVMKTINKLP